MGPTSDTRPSTDTWRQVTAGGEALRCIAADDTVTHLTYGELGGLTGRFANALTTLGVGRQEGVFTLLGRCPELYVTVLGTLRSARVLCPLFSAFGPEPVRQRLELGDAGSLSPPRRSTGARSRRTGTGCPIWTMSCSWVRSLIHPRGPFPLPSSWSMPHRSTSCRPPNPEDMVLLHFTSGTTRAPKRAVHVHEAVVAHHATAAFALDLRQEDVYWCTADPGWVTGTSYGIIASSPPARRSLDEGDFDVHRWYRILDSERVTVWYTAPTAVRMLMRATPREGTRNSQGRTTCRPSDSSPAWASR